MDYEKKYNKLVEAIKQLQKANPSDESIQNWVNDNVPELRESEDDEKIRKWLICGMNTLKEKKNETFATIPIDDAIAWLEKQKEPELSEDFGEYVAELGKQFPEVSFAKLSRIAVRVKNWFQKQRKKSTWSEEDEKVLNDINITLFEEKNIPNVKYWKFMNWLKSLKNRTQPKQEWSEEDENNINSIVSRLEVDISYWESRSKTRTNEDEKLINWLKSLRPQNKWKPSDEQMKWLKDVIETVPMTCRQQIPLELLYNDLKKLKGE